MGIMNKDLNRLLVCTCKRISRPAYAASRATIQWIFHIHYMRFIFALIDSQINVICIKRDRCISTINTNIFAIRGQHMKISSQRYISLSRRNVVSFFNLLPLTVGDTVLAVEIYLCRNSVRSLIAVGITIPQQKSCQEKYQQNSCNFQHGPVICQSSFFSAIFFSTAFLLIIPHC